MMPEAWWWGLRAGCILQLYHHSGRMLDAEFKYLKRSHMYTGEGSFSSPSELTGPGKDMKLVLCLPAVGTLTLY